MNEQPAQMNIYSSRITQPKSQGASQAMLLATGLTHSDLNQAQVGIAACWYEGNPLEEDCDAQTESEQGYASDCCTILTAGPSKAGYQYKT